jgi:O-antigen ligase
MTSQVHPVPVWFQARDRLAALLPDALLLFIAAGFLFPSLPAYALVFYVLVAPAALAASPGVLALRSPGAMLGTLLIVWSGLTLIWGHDDHNRSAVFAIDSAMTVIFLVAMLAGLRRQEDRRRLATVLIWAGAINAALSIALAQIFPLPTERLHGWGATSHPILGATVMGMAYLTALWRMLTEAAHRRAHAAACVVMAAFILMTESRGPMLAAGMATLFICAAGTWRWRALATLSALAAGWMLLPAGMRHHQAAAMVYRGSSHRFEIWDRTLHMIADRPLFGHGLAANLDLPGITFPHDLYLSVLFYSGAVGFSLFVGLAGWVTWQLRPSRDPEWLWLVALWMNALISGLTDLGQITKGPGPMWFIFWLPVGLVLGREGSTFFFEKKNQETSGPRSRGSG